MKRTFLRTAALVAVLALVLTACGGDDTGGTTGPSPGATGTGTGGIDKGGIFRTALEDFGFVNAFDPTGEYLGGAWALYNVLLRNLVTYRHIAGDAGSEIIPDLATEWETSADGLTWTFHLRKGVMWGPPVNREITSQDFAFALQRINTESLVAQYGFYYYGVISGMDGEGKSQTDPLPGVETPDDYTLVLHLDRPTGDLLNRLAMAAAAPVPEEVAGCFDRAGDYGRYLVSSAGYMIQGSEEQDATSCDTLQPLSGFDPDKHLVFVRNPNYDATLDDPEARSNNPDGFVFTINTNTDDIFNKVESGELDASVYSNPSGALLQRYSTNPDLQDNVYSFSQDTTYYITMNLLVPPFDDVHVRRAVNFVIDKDALLKANGGSLRGSVATTVEPPSVNPETADYNPYPSPNHQGDLDAAKAEMQQSAYDSDGDGICDAPECSDLIMINRNYSPWTEMAPIVTENLASIGIEVQARDLETDTAYTAIQTADNLIPIALNARWGKDYPGPFGFDYFVFNAEAGVACEGQSNYAELGMTEDQAAECGDAVLDAWNAATDNGANPLPSVDEKMDECVALQGDELLSCFAELDAIVMEEGVPWVPYMWVNWVDITNDSLSHYEFDQFSGQISYPHIAVNNGLTVDDIVV